MKIAIITDAWQPQVNGVVMTLSKTAEHLEKLGHEVYLVTPDQFTTVPCPSYKSIRLAVFPKRKVRKMLDEFAPQAIHIATEGPLGLAGRHYCKKKGLRFTTSFHTQFPEYVRMRIPVPLSLSYAFVRWFHGAADITMVPTPNRLEALQARGFNNLKIWSRGVDTDLFYPRDKHYLTDNRPICMYMGRTAVEKNIRAFLDLDLPGSRVVVGGGPDLEILKKDYPDVHFTGYKFGEELAQHVSAADVLVFPSLTDTFGLVMLEAMACGVPVAAFPVPGPIDVVQNGVTGILDNDLHKAIDAALKLDPEYCRRYAEQHSWMAATIQFANYLQKNPGQHAQSVADCSV